MTIHTDISTIVPTEWSDLLAKSKVSSWFQSPEAYRLFDNSRDEMTPWLVGVSRDGVGLVGLVMGYVTYSRHFPLWTARSIIQGGPLLADDIRDDELRALLSAMSIVMPSSIYWEMRNFADYSRWRSIFECSGWRYEPHYDITISCEGDYYSRLSESKQRQVRKLQREGMSWREATSKQDVLDFYDKLHHLYHTKIHRPLFSASFYVRAWESGACKVLVVEQQNKIIGGVLMPVAANTIYEWYICGDTLSTYSMLEWSANNGCTIVDTMGAGRPGVAYGVRDFKLSMGGQLDEWGRYIRVLKPLKYTLGTIATKLI